MKTNRGHDYQIKSALLEETEKIEPSKELFNKIKTDINKLEGEKIVQNKKTGFKNSKRVIIMAASFMLIASLTAWGIAKGNSWIGHSNLKYKSFPSGQQIMRDVGFLPKYTDSLPGGFEYSDGGTGESKLLDDTGSILTTTKEISLGYKRQNEESTINLTITQLEEAFLDRIESKLVGSFEGVDLYYYEKDYKFVPPNYELTEEDKILYERGELEISYGTSDISICNIQGISWYEDGLEYSIMSGDYNFTIDEMIEMAKSVIKQQ